MKPKRDGDVFIDESRFVCRQVDGETTDLDGNFNPDEQAIL